MLGHHSTHTSVIAPDPFSPADIDAHRLALHMAYAEAHTGHNIEAPPRPVRDFVLNFLALLAALTIIPLGTVLLLKEILQ